MSLENPKPEEKGFFETSKDDFSWKPCLRCGAEITQIRKAFFQCINCAQEYIIDEEDMKK